MIHIHAPIPDVSKIKQHCPTCGEEQVFVVTSFEWYAGESTCLHCGDCWNEDGRLPRPFMRNWKKERIDAAELLYADAEKQVERLLWAS